MGIKRSYISTISQEFWRNVGFNPIPPYDIQGAISLQLPLDVVSLSTLSLKKIKVWLNERNIVLPFQLSNKHLHGFILIYRNCGFLFINGSDPECERRFTMAHELSHYLLDYKIPRDRAIKKLGLEIMEVLDGLRSPTNLERIDGVLSAINIKPFTHLLEKGSDGSFVRETVKNSENLADHLAFELLAPRKFVIKQVLQKENKISFERFLNKSKKLLTERYDLPDSLGHEYAAKLAYSVTGGPSIISKLGL